MKRARLSLTWDELLVLRRGLGAERDVLVRMLERNDPKYPAVKQHYEEQIALVDGLLPRVEKAIGRT